MLVHIQHITDTREFIRSCEITHVKTSSLVLQSHDPHRCPVPRGGVGALPEVLCEGEIIVTTWRILPAHLLTMTRIISVTQFVFKTEPFASSTTRTVHEELAKAMTAILKPSTDFLTSNKLLKVRYRCRVQLCFALYFLV